MFTGLGGSLLWKVIIQEARVISTATENLTVIILLMIGFVAPSDLNCARSSSRKMNAMRKIKEQMTFGVSRK